MARLGSARARRIALAAQGFCDRRPSGRPDVRHLRRVMDRMAVLQLDSVNALCRSHYLPVLARLGPYDRAKLDDYLYRSGEHFEYFSHEASLTAQDNQPYLRFRHRSVRWKGYARLERENPGYVQAVYDEVAADGPLSVRGLEDPGKRSGPWWGIPKGKAALEALYFTGRINISDRDLRFVSHYDLPHNVLRPDVLAHPDIDEPEAKKHLLELGARAHGIATGSDIADYFRLKVTEARPLLDRLVAEGRLEKVEVEGWSEPAYLHVEAAKPRSVSTRALLSPFDPVVWFRPRAERLFGFEYRIEIYVPEPKRVYGYYVLPFLLDDELVARVDLKADRQDGVLRVRGSYLEPDARADRVAPELAAALEEMAQWLGLDGVMAEPKGDLAPALARQIRPTGVAAG
jgi:uncharacterized protein YcaQ